MAFPFFHRRDRTPASSRDAPMPDRLRDFVLGKDTDALGSASGMPVDERSALRVSAVYACVRLIAETVASLPFPLYQYTSNGGREPARDHPLYTILHDIPNEDMTSFSFREAMMTSLLLWGNAYAQIVRRSGVITALYPLKPDQVDPQRDPATGNITYIVQGQTGTQRLPPAQMLHIPALSFDGLAGISPIAQAWEAIGLSLAAEEYGARFFGNGARPGGVLEHPGAVKDPAKLRESWEAVYKGAHNAQKICVLEEGMKYHAIGIPPEDAQFLETRKFQVNEICRIFHVPPHMVGDLERSTNNNIEEQSIEFVVYSIRPWLVRWEQAVFKSLLTPEERRRYFARYNVEGLLRGDFKARMEGYAVGRQNGWLSANDIRALEEMNPISKDQGGDLFLVNGNMTTASNAARQGGGTDGDGAQGAGDGGTAD